MTLSRIVLFLALSLFAAAAAWPQDSAQRRVVDRFDHYQTGFPLEGAHERVDCQQCHRRGVFRGIAKRCADCHNNIAAEGMGFRHIPTALECSECHTVQDWRLARFDHTGFSFGCVRCHNNFTAPGKTANHPVTSSVCEDCHSTVHWPLLLPGGGRAGPGRR